MSWLVMVGLLAGTLLSLLVMGVVAETLALLQGQGLVKKEDH